jgi:hypothetical protein
MAENISNYWVILKKCVDTKNGKRKHYIILCGELTLEEGMDL